MDKLKPCPFCGGKAVIKVCTKKQAKASMNGVGDTELKNMPNRWIFMGCETEGCILHATVDKNMNRSSLFFRFGSKQEAIEKWDRRADE